MTHEWGHICWRTHQTLEIIDDLAFDHFKSTHPEVIIDYADCGGGQAPPGGPPTRLAGRHHRT